MALIDILPFIDDINIAESIDKEKLDEIGDRIKRQFQEDLDSMEDWREDTRLGVDLMKQEFKTKSIPWEGASNFKSPLLTEASINFGDKASLELLRSKNLVKADIIGKDPQGQKKARSERVTEGMNYQINYQMSDWRDDQKRLFYSLPNTGTMFKKTVFNPLSLTTESHIIQYPDFVVNQATTSMRTARSFTQIMDFNANEVEERRRSGLWLDVDIYPEDSDGDEGSNEAQGVTDADANVNRFLEQQCFADLDDDGLEEPYTITIHEQSSQVVRITARFDLESLIVKTANGRVMTLKKFTIENPDTLRMIRDGEQPPEVPDLNGVALVRIDPLQNITKYGFIPSPDGTFLDLGYAHLLGAITQGINTSTNQLFDAGKLRNVGGGFMAKNVRKKMGPVRMKIGEWISTDLTAQSLKDGFFPNPQPEPSAVLFQMTDKLESQGRTFATLTNDSGAIQANTAPTTALAIIQENLISTSALLGRVLDAESKEFQVLFRLNQRFFDPELYQMIMDDPNANAFQDFNSDELDLVPTANAEMSSKMQRIQLASVELEQFDRVVQVGGNAKAILRNYFDNIGTQNIDQIFPDPGTMTPEEEQQIQQLQQAQKLGNDLAQAQLELQQLQIELFTREQDRLDARARSDIEKQNAEIQKTLKQLEEAEADIILTLEKAETEEIKNGISTYTESLRVMRESLQTIEAINAARQPDTAGTGTPGPIRAVA